MPLSPQVPGLHRPLRLACIGHAALDHMFHIRAFPGHPTKTPAQAYAMQPGGMALNASIAAARLGASVRLLGRVGEDAAAAYLRQRLRDEKVEARGLETVPGAVTSVSAIAVDARGERQIYNHRGDALERAHALDQRQLAGADIVLADPRWRAGAASALRWAREQGLPSVLDADIAPREDLRALVALAGWAVFSELGLHCFAPGVATSAALALALDVGCEVAMVTRGARSVLWMRRGGPLQEARAPRIRARDTTGAGDVFHAALAVALGEGMTESRAVAFAVTAAALKCKNGQGAFGAPRRADLARDSLHNPGESVAAGSGWAARRLFAAHSPAMGKETNAADRPSPADHRSQGVMQRVPRRPLAFAGQNRHRAASSQT